MWQCGWFQTQFECLASESESVCFKKMTLEKPVACYFERPKFKLAIWMFCFVFCASAIHRLSAILGLSWTLSSTSFPFHNTRFLPASTQNHLSVFALVCLRTVCRVRWRAKLSLPITVALARLRADNAVGPVSCVVMKWGQHNNNVTTTKTISSSISEL